MFLFYSTQLVIHLKYYKDAQMNLVVLLLFLVWLEHQVSSEISAICKSTYPTFESASIQSHYLYINCVVSIFYGI